MTGFLRRGLAARQVAGLVFLVLLGLALAGPARAADAEAACAPAILRVQVAPEAADAPPGGQRPADGWQAAELPQRLPPGWPDGSGRAAWYRIDWVHPCPQTPVALALNGINMAGEVYVGELLLWRDMRQTEPMSRNWNVPRQWQLAPALLHGEAPPVWVRVQGPPGESLGLRRVFIGTAEAVQAHHARQVWSQRTIHFVNLVISGVLGLIFLFVWLMRRSLAAYGWFALMSLFWVLFMSNVLATQTWPFPDGITVSRANASALLLYVACFVQFVRRFGHESPAPPPAHPAAAWRPWAWRSLWAVWALALASVWATGVGPAQTAFLAVTVLCALMFVGGCLFGTVRARRAGASPEERLLALCLLVFSGICIHDVLVVVAHAEGTLLTPYAAPLSTLSMAALLGWRMARATRRIERFNEELGLAIAQAREDLRGTLVREHDLALDNTRLQERLRIAHDLHDGLGGSLVRSMAWVEQRLHSVRGEQMLSMLKVLRDDLRQVIDTSSSHGLMVPTSPADWGAPLRHRFTRLFEELGIRSEWDWPAHWRGGPPDTLPCLMLRRVVEEAMTNVLKHSRARQVRVQLTQPDAHTLVLVMEDDGIGFDVEGVLRGGLSIGMHSMQARVARIHGTLDLGSHPGCTRIEVRVPLAPRPPGAQAD